MFTISISIFHYIKKINQKKYYSRLVDHQSQLDSLITNHCERNYLKAIPIAESLIDNIKDELSYIENNSIYPIYIDMLILTKQYSKALEKCIEWQEVSVKYNTVEFFDERHSHLIGLLISYYYLEDYQNLDKVLKTINKDDFMKANPDNGPITRQMVLEWYLTVIINYANDIDSAKSIINNFDYFRLDFVRVKLIGERSIEETITNTIEIQNLFNSDSWSDKYRRFVKYEETNMFLAYLYYKNNDIDNALKYFKLSLNKTEASTFNGNWEVWLGNRNYYRDQHEILIELSKTYTSKFVEYDTPPQPIRIHFDDIPLFAYDGPKELVCILQIEVYYDGSIGEIIMLQSALSGPGGLDEVAINSIRKWEFTPAVNNENNISCWTTTKIKFDMSKRKMSIVDEKNPEE